MFYLILVVGLIISTSTDSHASEIVSYNSVYETLPSTNFIGSSQFRKKINKQYYLRIAARSRSDCIERIRANGKQTTEKRIKNCMAKGAKSSIKSTKVSPINIPKLSSSAYKGPVIDAHSQIDNKTNLDKVIPLLGKADVQHVILSWRGKRSAKDIVSIARNNPNRITASIRLKGQHFDNNSSKFKRQLANRKQSGNFGAMAEALIFHAQKGKKAAKVVNNIESPQVSSAFGVAQKHGWPFIIHIEFAAAQKSKKTYMRSLEHFLKKNTDHPIALIHMGQLGFEEVSRLVELYPNIYFLTSRANTILVNKSKYPWTNMFLDKKLAKNWKSLVIKYPDRFILAIDNVWAEHWTNMYVQQVNYWREALGELPESVAHAVAHKNAEKLWNPNSLK